MLIKAFKKKQMARIPGFQLSIYSYPRKINGRDNATNTNVFKFPNKNRWIGQWQECQEQWEDWTETESTRNDIQIQVKKTF